MQLLAIVVVTFAGACLILWGWHHERPPGSEQSARWRRRPQPASPAARERTAADVTPPVASTGG